jgi:CheY-like chemotaxis protein
MLKPILLVEDDPHDLELTLLALEKIKLTNEIVVARDGQEALDYLRGQGKWQERQGGNPAVVLLDLKLPKIDGLDVLHEIKQDPLLSMAPVVMVTSSREESDLVRSYDRGVNAYVVKPVEFSEFMKAIGDLGMFWAVVNQAPPGPMFLFQ